MNLLLARPGVRNVALVAMPDPLLGERTCAFAVTNGPVTREDVRAFLRRRGVAEYKLPDRLELLESLPTTKVGQVGKAALRELIRARSDGDPGAGHGP